MNEYKPRIVWSETQNLTAEERAVYAQRDMPSKIIQDMAPDTTHSKPILDIKTIKEYCDFIVLVIEKKAHIPPSYTEPKKQLHPFYGTRLQDSLSLIEESAHRRDNYISEIDAVNNGQMIICMK